MLVSDNRPAILVYINTNITGESKHNLRQSLMFLNEYKDKYRLIVFSMNKTERFLQSLIEDANLKFDEVICKGYEYWDDFVTNYKFDTWAQFMDERYYLDELENVEHVVCVKGLLSKQGRIQRDLPHFNDKVVEGHANIKFVSNSRQIAGFLSILKLCKIRNLPLHEMIYDTQEASAAQIEDAEIRPDKIYSYFLYDVKDYGYRRLDSFNYAHTYYPDAGLWKKDIDITMAYVAVTKDRSKINERVHEMFSNLEQIFPNSRLSREHGKLQMSRPGYMQLICRSKYTLIIPAYNPREMSIFRFIESINRDCLPLITEDVFTDDFIRTYDLDIDKVNRISVKYDCSNFRAFTEEERIDLICYFKHKVCRVTKLLEIPL